MNNLILIFFLADCNSLYIIQAEKCESDWKGNWKKKINISEKMQTDRVNNTPKLMTERSCEKCYVKTNTRVCESCVKGFFIRKNHLSQ